MRFLPFLLFTIILQASNARIMTYNLLNYEDENSREDDYITILNLVEPDLIIVEEVIGQTGYSHFKSDVLDVFEPGEWTGATFTNQSASQDIALYFKHETFSFLSTTTINTASSSGLRDVVEFVMEHESSGIEFKVYGVHLKASSGSANAAQRLEEASILRAYLNEFEEGSYFMVAGDFNIYSNSSSDEPAFDMLTGDASDNDGQLFDPIDRVGPWHNNSSYADVHTQSPRTTSFGGGAPGGMDDRFDWIFTSAEMLNPESEMRYIDETYTALGNDGNHFNDAINNGNNLSVSDIVADAIHDASDHLPVYMDVWFDDLVYNEAGIVITEIMANPSAVSDSYGEWFEIKNTTDMTINLDGWSLTDGGSDEHIISNDSSSMNILPGEYFVFGRNGDSALNGGYVPNYEYSGFLLSNSEDEIIILDSSGAIVDEVHYTSSWNFGNGSSMELHDVSSDNFESENWFEASITFGSGDFGTPGTFNDGSVAMELEVYPTSFMLDAPYPNPFNPITTIRFSIHESIGAQSLKIYDINGRIVKSLIQRQLNPGQYEMTWRAQNQASGLYFIQFMVGSKSMTQKVILLK
ncbi:lamin tail domain-containing protein [Candidatus Marinimicrobia bacterium]|nr:lamin tail domain-containing protein [Candidatus Neomarinimicrobiota bacterium]